MGVVGVGMVPEGGWEGPEGIWWGGPGGYLGGAKLVGGILGVCQGMWGDSWGGWVLEGDI